MEPLKKKFAGLQTKIEKIFRRSKSLIKHPFKRKNQPLLHTIEWVFILLAFFAVGFPIIYFKSTENIIGEGKLKSVGGQESVVPPSEEEKKFIGENVEKPVLDTSGWDTYRNQWYGFEIKHPESWTNMQYRSASSKDSSYETVYKFRKDSSGENDSYIGFDVSIYSIKKATSVDQTDDIQKKDGAPEDTSNCQFSEELTPGEENNAFQKVSVGRGNACFEPTYFFSIQKGTFRYDIVPIANDKAESPANIEQNVNQYFPEYKEAVDSFKLIPVSKPTSAPSKPRISAPRPISAKMVGGRLVCAKKNDKPGKSQNGNEPGHMDMECCLDPDETPNPWCTYSNPKYQKFLK